MKTKIVFFWDLWSIKGLWSYVGFLLSEGSVSDHVRGSAHSGCSCSKHSSASASVTEIQIALAHDPDRHRDYTIPIHSFF